MDMELVSIVVATYRREIELDRALRSLTNQTHTNIEIIVVDDNADPVWNNAVSHIVESVKAISKNICITLVANEINKGSAESRNIGIRLAKGKFVTFLDDDDVYLPQKVEKQLADLIANNADYDLTDLYLYNDNEKLIDRRIRSYIEDTSKEALLRYHLMYHMTGTDTFMFKSDYLKKIGGFPEIDVGDEFYLMIEAINGGGVFVYSPHCYVKAYVHVGEDGGLSSGSKKIKGENRLYEYKKSFFSNLQHNDIKFIKMRHYAVLTFAYKRCCNVFCCCFYGFVSFFTSPIQFVRLILNRK